MITGTLKTTNPLQPTNKHVSWTNRKEKHSAPGLPERTLISVLFRPDVTWLPSSRWDGAHVSVVWPNVPASPSHDVFKPDRSHLLLLAIYSTSPQTIYRTVPAGSERIQFINRPTNRPNIAAYRADWCNPQWSIPRSPSPSNQSLTMLYYVRNLKVYITRMHSFSFPSVPIHVCSPSSIIANSNPQNTKIELGHQYVLQPEFSQVYSKMSTYWYS